ncbi:MAG: hypothetical protein QNK40_00135 [Desulfobacterales bacterium]|nr:hypothetical protein [Desulfobacterales bacterium]
MSENNTRLNVFPITITPLRHRVIDIPALLSFFIERKTRELNLSSGKKPAPGSIETLQTYHWPGNVRELENMVERALIRNSASPQEKFPRFDELNLSPMAPSKQSVVNVDVHPVLNMDEAMKRHIESILQLTKGKIGGEDGAATLLGLPTSTLRHRMKNLGMFCEKKTQQQTIK